jgi:8-oxo-dGTP pyrophosphatase MutT (NUDIX family)
MRFTLVLERLAALPAELPPPAAELVPVVLGTGGWRPPAGPPGTPPARSAGVLVLLFPDEAGEARVVLTERATRDGHHSGEVSLPGGKAEPDDDDIVATALRETVEEIGLDLGAMDLRVVGILEPFWIPVSNYDVTPVVSLVERRPAFTPSSAEVARILEPPMARFLPGTPIRMVERTVRDWPLRYGVYDVDGLAVWGATARILSQLGAVLGRA